MDRAKMSHDQFTISDISHQRLDSGLLTRVITNSNGTPTESGSSSKPTLSSFEQNDHSVQNLTKQADVNGIELEGRLRVSIPSSLHREPSHIEIRRQRQRTQDPAFGRETGSTLNSEFYAHMAPAANRRRSDRTVPSFHSTQPPSRPSSSRNPSSESSVRSCRSDLSPRQSSSLFDAVPHSSGSPDLEIPSSSTNYYFYTGPPAAQGCTSLGDHASEGGTDLSRTGSNSSRSQQFHTHSGTHGDENDSSFHFIDDKEGRAVELVDEGKSKIIDRTRLLRWGDFEQLAAKLRNERSGQFDGGVIEDLAGSTHLLLPSNPSVPGMLMLLEVLLPVISDTLVVLDLHNNSMRSVPHSLARCTRLEELNLSYNPIPYIPDCLNRMSELRVLALDGCDLTSLPPSLVYSQRLHTICLRHNRLIALPPWLSQLPSLETLLIRGNPFAGPWKTLSAAIIDCAPSEGENVTRRMVQPTLPERSLPTTPSMGLRPTMTPSESWPASSPNIKDHDHANAQKATVRTSHQTDDCSPALRYTEEDPQVESRMYGSERKVHGPMRRMRSAGDLIGGSSSKSAHDDSQNRIGPKDQADHLKSGHVKEQAWKIQSRILGDDGQTETLVESSDACGASSSKSGKWGFLKKMSMGRMRAGSNQRNQNQQQAGSKQWTSNFDGRPTQPPVTRSSSSLPTNRLIQEDGDLDDFGLPKQHGNLDIRGLPARHLYDTTQRGKRRSFLPILEGPPSLDVTIPSISTSPFSVPNLSLSPRPDQFGETRQGATPDPQRNKIGASPASGPDDRRTVSYNIGLRSIMSYLGDLYDLTLPVPTVQGGAEVIYSEPGTASGSLSGTSDSRSGPSSPFLGDYPTGHMRRGINAELDEGRQSRGQSPNNPRSPTALSDSINGSDHVSEIRPLSAAKSHPPEPVPVKRYKNDANVRIGVIKHIIDTERVYVRGLLDLVDIYVRPGSLPVPRGDSETVVPANERKVVFGGIEGILQFHSSSFLPALEKAALPLLNQTPDQQEDVSQRVAIEIAEVFKQYHPFMRQYSAYINNFDYALLRLRGWTGSGDRPSQTAIGSVASSDPNANISAGAASAGLGIASAANTMSRSGTAAGTVLSVAQRKRLKSFLKHCRKQPRHTQINLESYLLLPVQRIPRYRMLLEDLARSTPPIHGLFGDPIEDALQEMISLASSMNEEKRDSESRRKLVKWQQRIKGRFATPLVQAHRRLLLDGALVITRNVKRSATLVEVPRRILLDESKDQTITDAKAIVQVETLAPEVMSRPVLVLLATDMMLLCKDPSSGRDPDCPVELFAVLKLQTKRKPASLMNETGIRLVDNRNILYLSAPTHQEALNWVRVINNEFDPTR